MRICALFLLLLLNHAARADVLDGRMHHLRSTGDAEWDDLAEAFG